MQQNTQENFFKNSKFVMTRRKLSTYLETFEIHRHKLSHFNNKKILLIGGGNSQIKRTFEKLRIKCDITNVDPYIINPNTAHTNIKDDFNNTKFINEFDEIWAMYSLPLYSPSLEHAIKFYNTAIIALKPGGILRIGGHPRTIDGPLLAPQHFSCSYFNIKTLDIHLRLFRKYLKHRIHKTHETYTTTNSFTLKNKLNQQVINSR